MLPALWFFSCLAHSMISFLRLTKIWFLLLFGLLNLFSVQAQVITFSKAIEMGLEQNLQIKIAKNEAEIATLNNNIGNAGMLPVVNLNINTNASKTNINQKFSNGLAVERKGVNNNAFNASLGVNWRIFDGFRMFAEKQRLEELQAIGSIQLSRQIATLVQQIAESYFRLVVIKRQMSFMQSLLEVSEEREKLALLKWQIGSTAKPEWLQAKVDLNEQKIALLNAQDAYEQTKIQIAQWISPGKNLTFEPEDTIVLETGFDASQYANRVANENPQLLIAKKNFIIGKLLKKEVLAQQLPSLSLTPSFNLTRNQSNAGFALLNQNSGPGFGAALTIPIFTGFNLGSALKVADLSNANLETQTKDLENVLNTSFTVIQQQHQNALKVLQLEQENMMLGQENVNINRALYKQSQINVLNFRLSQTTWAESQSRFYNALYLAKMAEISMKLLGGETPDKGKLAF